jgi:apolipoprotein N-acyltransferase
VAPLLALAERVRPKRALLLGWLAGTTGIGLAFSWLVYAMRVFGGFPTPVAALLYAPVALSMGAQLGLFLALVAWLGPTPLGLGAPLAFVALELLFPKLFPWHLANSQYRVVALLQSGELAGPYLLSFAIVWANVALLALARLVRARGAGASGTTASFGATIVAPLALVTLLIVAGAWRLDAVRAARASAPAIRVGLVQGNISVEHKGNRAYFGRNIDAYRQASRAVAADVDLLIWPETVFQHDLDTRLTRLAGDDDPFPDAPRPILFGGLAVTRGPGIPLRVYNSAFLRDVDGRLAGRYDKRILVPFGEYMPLGDRFPWLRTLSPGTSNFSAGTEPAVLPVGTAARLGPLICYEDVIPGPAREAVAHGATLLVNLTNDAWYGDGAEPLQHQALAVWRAVETRRDLMRATNTGLTSVVAASGDVLGELPTFRDDTLVSEVRALDTTTVYGAAGDVFAWCVVIATVALGMARRGRERRLRASERAARPRRRRRKRR